MIGIKPEPDGGFYCGANGEIMASQMAWLHFQLGVALQKIAFE